VTGLAGTLYGPVPDKAWFCFFRMKKQNPCKKEPGAWGGHRVKTNQGCLLPSWLTWVSQRHSSIVEIH
jgi:hypothetical protein